MTIAEGIGGQHIGFLVGTRKSLTAAISPLAGRGTQVVSMSGIVSTDVRVVDESGRPVEDVEIGLVIRGVPLPFLGTRTSSDGRVSVAVESPVPVDVVVRTPQAGTFNLSLEEVRQSGTIVVSVPTTQLQVVDLNGGPISFATVSGQSSDYSETSTQSGEVRLSGGGIGGYLVSKPGYWPAIVQRSDSVAVLRKDCSGVEFLFRLDTESTIKIAPTFDIGYELAFQPTRIDSEPDAWRLPSLPEGKYKLVAFDRTGAREKQSILVITP